MNRRLILVTTMAALLVFGLVRFGPAAAAQNPSSQPSAQPSPSMPEMMKMHEQMMAQMAAADAHLDALVKEMDAASGNAKVVAMAAVVRELVQQHKLMHGRVGQMHQQMMGGRGGMMGR